MSDENVEPEETKEEKPLPDPMLPIGSKGVPLAQQHLEAAIVHWERNEEVVVGHLMQAIAANMGLAVQFEDGTPFKIKSL